MSAFQASQQRQRVSGPVVSVTSRWTAEERYKWEVGEELGQPGWGLSQLEMGGAPARERSKGVRARNGHPCFAAGRPGTDRHEEEEVEGGGQTGQEIYDQRH